MSYSKVDQDLVAAGRHLRHLADLDAEDPHVRAREEADRALELAGDADPVLPGPERVGAGDEGHDREGGDEARDETDAGHHFAPGAPTGTVRFAM